MTQPGWTLRRMAARIVDHKTMERVVDPMLADLQGEYAEAVRRGRVWRSRWILLTGHVVFLKTIAVCGAETTLRGWTVDDRSAMSRTLGFSMAATAAATVVFAALPRPLAGSSFWPRADPTLLVYLLPQALVLGVPVGLTFGIFLGLRGGRVSYRSAGGVLACAILCSFACLLMLLWIVPMANQEFRVLVSGQDRSLLWKGINELSLGELSERIDANRRAGLWEGNLLFTYHARWALSCATLVLALFALSVTRRLVRRWTVALAAFGTYVGYYWLSWAGRAAALQDSVPAFAGAWLPNVVLAIVSVALLKVARPKNELDNRVIG